MSKQLTLTEIREAQDVGREEVEIPEWGGVVVVQGVDVETGLTLLKNMTDVSGKIDEETAMRLAVLIGVVEPKFSEEDWAWLKKKSLTALAKVTKAFMRLSGFDAAELKEARKNSLATDEGDSSLG